MKFTDNILGAPVFYHRLAYRKYMLSHWEILTHISCIYIYIYIYVHCGSISQNKITFKILVIFTSWRQHPTRHQVDGHLPPITKTIQVRRTRHAGHCWRSRDELIRDVLLWTPTYGRAKAERPAWTYIQQLCEDTGCCPEDLPRVMNDREEWRERVRDIRATSAIWWWLWYNYWVEMTAFIPLSFFHHVFPSVIILGKSSTAD